MTPLRLYDSKFAPQKIMVDLETEHTCRDFDAILDWAMHHRDTGTVGEIGGSERIMHVIL